MLTRSRQVALVLTAVLTAGAACQARHQEPDAAPPGGTFTLVASGAVLPHAAALERARFDAGGHGYDFRPMLAAVRPLVSRAGLALCHLRPAPGTPPELAEALTATGYDDCGAGSGGRTVLRAGQARVAHLERDGADGAARILADARAARRAGADVVVLSMRWGTPWQDEPDTGQLALARALTAARTSGRPDVDLVLGTGARVPQPYAKVNGTWVAYGLGDQVPGGTVNGQGVPDPRGERSSTARFTFVPPGRPGGRWRVTRAEFVPQLYDMDAGRVVDLNRALAAGAEVGPARDRVRDVVLSRGAAKDGLVLGE
ncbi:CapA family protein [Streptomyces sp. NPDC048182]|uniref:CapA family protein n=1 Tax=Streptomyces sp. NPDC048182 TaxID=3365507 RepID=UPI003710F75A